MATDFRTYADARVDFLANVIDARVGKDNGRDYFNMLTVDADFLREMFRSEFASGSLVDTSSEALDAAVGEAEQARVDVEGRVVARQKTIAEGTRLVGKPIDTSLEEKVNGVPVRSGVEWYLLGNLMPATKYLAQEFTEQELAAARQKDGTFVGIWEQFGYLDVARPIVAAEKMLEMQVGAVASRAYPSREMKVAELRDTARRIERAQTEFVNLHFDVLRRIKTMVAIVADITEYELRLADIDDRRNQLLAVLNRGGLSDREIAVIQESLAAIDEQAKRADEEFAASGVKVYQKTAPVMVSAIQGLHLRMPEIAIDIADLAAAYFDMAEQLEFLTDALGTEEV